jgi:hypothetical protein
MTFASLKLVMGLVAPQPYQQTLSAACLWPPSFWLLKQARLLLAYRCQVLSQRAMAVELGLCIKPACLHCPGIVALESVQNVVRQQVHNVFFICNDLEIDPPYEPVLQPTGMCPTMVWHGMSSRQLMSAASALRHLLVPTGTGD